MKTEKKENQETTKRILLALILLLVGFVIYLLLRNEKDSSSSRVEDPIESLASDRLRDNEQKIQENPEIITTSPNDMRAVGITSLVTIKNIDKVNFSGDAGFAFLQISRGSIPIFFFHQSLISKAGRTGVEPQLYKPEGDQGVMKFQKKGEYFYFIDDGKKIINSPGDQVLITGNAYLGMKPNGYEAWLAYELEAQGYAEINGDAQLWYNQKTGGVDFATKIENYKFLN